MRSKALSSFLLLSLSVPALAGEITFVNAAQFDPESGTPACQRFQAADYRLRDVTHSGHSGLAEWNLDAVPSGQYRVEVTGDRPCASPVFVVEEKGRCTTVTLSSLEPGQWHTLGSFEFVNSGRVTQVLSPASDTKLDSVAAVRLVPQALAAVSLVNSVPPAIGLCIDDLGNRAPSVYANAMFTGAPNLTYAIIGLLTQSVPVLQAAQQRGVETFTHQPMQYVGQGADPDPNLDPNRLYVSSSDAETMIRLRRNLDGTAPYTIGLNNHEGSAFTQYTHGMELVIDELKARDMVFYDSRTISTSIAWPVALQRGVLSTKNDRFLDDANSNTTTRNNITSFASSALGSPNYSWCGIAHERPNSVYGIIDAMPILASMGVEVRPISRQCVYVVESDFQPVGATFSSAGITSTSLDDMISEECVNGTACLLSGAAPGSARFTAALPKSGNYRVFVGYSYSTDSSDAARVTVHGVWGDRTFVLNQQVESGRWHYVGTYPFSKDGLSYVQLDTGLCTNPAHWVRTEAVKFQYDGPVLNNARDWELYL